jgi:hypothetical protein
VTAARDDEDLTPFQEAAATAHEMFSAYVTAGFDDNQALTIVIALLTAAQQAGMVD